MVGRARETGCRRGGAATLRTAWIFAAVVTALSAGCEESGPPAGSDDGADAAGGSVGAGGGGPGGAGGDDGAGGSTGGSGPRFASVRNNLRFKGADRLAGELMRALDLGRDQICDELGAFDCLGAIHNITLGGVEPYNANIYRPFEGISVGAPMAVERVVLAACTRRILLDVENPGESVLWGNIPLDGDRIADIDGSEVEAALTALFRRGVLRDPATEDLDDLRQMYRDIEADGGGDPALHWAQLSCMVVLTSTEALFY